MKIINIEYPSSLSEVKDIYNDNMDIFVELDDGMTYIFTVATPQNYYWYMDKEGIDYMDPGIPYVIVRSLTEENIRKVIETYLNECDGYWFKFYAMAGINEYAFSSESLDKMIEKIRQERKEEL